MTNTEAEIALVRQRRRVVTRSYRVATALADRRLEPVWFLGVRRAVTDLVGPLEDCDEGQLRAADWLLTAWQDLLEEFDTAALPWADPHEA